MEEWEEEFEWLRIRNLMKEKFGYENLPDLNVILLLIGIQELGRINPKFTKEEKQDLMHIATCRLLSYEGFYEFEGIDAEGWPHWKPSRAMDIRGVKPQEHLLKKLIIRYIKEQDL